MFSFARLPPLMRGRTQVVAAHVGAATSAIETQEPTLAARIEVQPKTVADLDTRVAQIDATIPEATRRGERMGRSPLWRPNARGVPPSWMSESEKIGRAS